MLKRHVFTWLSAILAIGFTVYITLDTFVIVKEYTKVEDSATSSVSDSQDSDSKDTENVTSDSGTEVSSSQGVYTENSYTDDNISISITQSTYEDTQVYVADIQLSSADYLKTALAKATYGKNVTAKTSEIAESVDAILAINGDYYGAQESGYVIRNGVIYRDTAESGQEDLVIYEDGKFEIISEDDISAEELLEKGAYNVLSFGPGLVENGTVSVDENDEVGKAMESNPRTAIGIIDDLHYVMVVADGRTSESQGLSLYQLAEFMDSLGVTCAYNLDGGGSSTMVFNGTVINNPTTSGKHIKERSVSDIVYIGY